ncbi:MAG: YihY family inner membrane protein [Azoarcus sp. PHD]|nr:MAG: YihY family inner membrane protein [Azoarcus sp. PHD]
MSLQSLRDFAELFSARFNATRCPQVASSLAFTTLLALVPLITVTLSVFSNLPGMDQLGISLKIFLLENLLPDRAGKIITTYAIQFSQKAARMTLIGTGLLAVTALMLLATIERVFNHIWGVRKPRPMLLRITVYWFMLTLGPAILGGSVFATGYLVSSSMEWSAHLPWISELAARTLPPLLLGALFSFLYYAVPNHPIRPLHAITGGLSAAVVFFLMQRAFGMFLAQFPTYTLIYGAFAVLPIFLVWLYLSWIVILLGALVTATLPAFLERRLHSPCFPGSEAWAAVSVLLELARAQQDGRTTPFTQLRAHTGLSEPEAETLLGKLGETGWTTRAESGEWVLTQAPERIPLSEVIRRFALDDLAWQAASEGNVSALAQRLGRSMRMEGETIASLLQSPQTGAPD